jgi:hypothetical protein
MVSKATEQTSGNPGGIAKDAAGVEEIVGSSYDLESITHKLKTEYPNSAYLIRVLTAMVDRFGLGTGDDWYREVDRARRDLTDMDRLSEVVAKDPKSLGTIMDDMYGTYKSLVFLHFGMKVRRPARRPIENQERDRGFFEKRSTGKAYPDIAREYNEGKKPADQITSGAVQASCARYAQREVYRLVDILLPEAHWRMEERERKQRRRGRGGPVASG